MTTPEIAEARRLAEELANTREELAELRREHDQRGGMLELTRMARDEVADELERLRAQVASLSREAWTWSKALEAQLAQSKPAQETAAAQVAPDGWTVRDRSDLEPGAIDVQGPGWARTILTRDGGDRMLYALAIALAPAPAQQADPKRELLERIVDGATPGEGGLTASLRAVAADALAQQAGQAPAPAPETDRQLGSDLEIALMEGHRIQAVDAYFNARHWMDGPTERKAYEAGYHRGWRDSNSAHTVQASAVADGKAQP